MDIQLETGGWVTVTFVAEATIALAVAAINTAMGVTCAVANGTQVELHSVVPGSASRVRTQNVLVGVTTKLGIPNNGDVVGGGTNGIVLADETTGTRYRVKVAPGGAALTLQAV